MRTLWACKHAGWNTDRVLKLWKRSQQSRTLIPHSLSDINSIFSHQPLISKFLQVWQGTDPIPASESPAIQVKMLTPGPYPKYTARIQGWRSEDLFFFFFFFWGLFRATPAAHGSFQAGGWIRAASLYNSHTRSKLHLQPTPKLTATEGAFNPLSKASDWFASSWILVSFVTAKPRQELQDLDFFCKHSKLVFFKLYVKMNLANDTLYFF